MTKITSVVSLAGLSALLSGPAFAEDCGGDPVKGFVCQPAGPVAAGTVFAGSDAGARSYVAVALLEEALELGGDDTGGGSGDRIPFDVYASVLYGDKDYETESLPGLNSDTWGGVLGATLYGDQYFAGIGVDYSQEDADIKDNAGSKDTDELGFQLYGTYYPMADKRLFLTGSFRYASLDIDTTRTFLTANDRISTARGSTDGSRVGLHGGAGYSWPFHNHTLFTLSGWLSWQDTDIDGYSETGALPENNGISGDLRYDNDSYSTLDGILTATLSHVAPITNGRLIPSLSLSYVHEFESDTRTINAALVNAPAQLVTFQTNKADRDYFRAAASLTAELNQGTTLYATYNGTFGHDWRQENLFTVGLVQAF